MCILFLSVSHDVLPGNVRNRLQKVIPAINLSQWISLVLITTIWLRLNEHDWPDYLLGFQRCKRLVNLIQAVLESGEWLGLYRTRGH